MTPHLAKIEFVDFLEGTLAAERRAHVSECDACRRTAEELSLVMASAATGDVPEPSPLFWDQLSDRVRIAIRDEPAPQSAFWQLAGVPGLRIAAAAAVVVLIAAFVWRAGSPVSQPLTPSSAPAAELAASDDLDGDDAMDLDADEAWALVRAVADDVAADDLDNEGVSSRPGSAADLALRLTERERLELARLLEEYVKRPAPPESAS